jgi:hypothetical protein
MVNVLTSSSTESEDQPAAAGSREGTACDLAPLDWVLISNSATAINLWFRDIGNRLSKSLGASFEANPHPKKVPGWHANEGLKKKSLIVCRYPALGVPECS